MYDQGFGIKQNYAAALMWYRKAGGSWVIQCSDPQGAAFALEGKRGRSPIGYFEWVGSRDSSGSLGRRWSW
jgi:hypothetical protein